MHKLKSPVPFEANQVGRYHVTMGRELDRDTDELVECW